MIQKVLLCSLYFCAGLLQLGLAYDKNYYNEANTQKNTLICQDLNAQNSLDLEHIMGMWFGEEVITHHDGGEYGEYVYDSCIVVHLSEITHEMVSTPRPHNYGYGSEYLSNDRERDRHHRDHHYKDIMEEEYKRQPVRYLRLIWDEKGTVLEYTLRFNNTRRGFWMSASPQKGTMLELPYNQFTGTIQVIKAVGTHIVLTFCQNLPANQLFTVVLSRHPKELTYEETQSIRSLLRRRGLSTSSVRKVCRNGASTLRTSFGTLLLIALAFIFKI